MNYNSYELEKGSSVRLTTSGGGEVSWSSSGPKTVKVEEDGTVTALAVGTAVITATAENGETASCAFTVPGVVSVDLRETSLTLRVGEEYVFQPELVKFGGGQVEITTESSDPDIAAVDGLTVKAAREERAELTFTAGGVSNKCKVRVEK